MALQSQIPAPGSHRCRRTALPAVVVVAATLALSGCGGEDERDQDRAGIRSLVELVNRAVTERDAAAWCRAYSPASIEKTFGSPARCRRETSEVITGSGGDRRLEVVGIAFEDSDSARVRFSGTDGEANLTRVDGRWYLDLLQEVQADPAPAPGGNG